MGGFGLTSSIDRPHQQREIACRGLDQQFLVDIFQTPHPEPVHASRIELVCEVAFDLFSAPALQPFAVFAPDPPPVGIYRFLLRCFAIPVTFTAFRFRYVRSDFKIPERHCHIVTVVLRSIIRRGPLRSFDLAHLMLTRIVFSAVRHSDFREKTPPTRSAAFSPRSARGRGPFGGLSHRFFLFSMVRRKRNDSVPVSIM
jgi:hypothetical protein